MDFLTGITNLTNWFGNVIMPTLAGLCELLPVREYLDGVMVQVDGSLVGTTGSILTASTYATR